VECERISLKTLIWGMFAQMRFVVLTENLEMSILRAAAAEKKR
jgi:hypothetical protein